MSFNKEQVEKLRKAALVLHGLANNTMKSSEYLGRGQDSVEESANAAIFLQDVRSVRDLADKIIEAIEMSRGAEVILSKISAKK